MRCPFNSLKDASPHPASEHFLSEPTCPVNDNGQIQFDEGKFYAHDIVDFGSLDLVRMGERLPNDSNVSLSLSPTAAAFDGNPAVQVAMPDGDIYFHRYDHDNCGENNTDFSGWRSPHNPDGFFGRL
jgi:glucoamylase